MDRKDLQELSKVRLKESAALLKAGLFDGAYYLAGYAVECALKACIAKETRRFEFPDKKRVDSSYSHRSEEHTSELQSLRHLVCRLLLEKKKCGCGWWMAWRAGIANRAMSATPMAAGIRCSFFLMLGRPPKPTPFP